MSNTRMNRIISFLLQLVLYTWVVGFSLFMLIILISFSIPMIIIWMIVGLAIAAPLFFGARYFWDKAAVT